MVKGYAPFDKSEPWEHQRRHHSLITATLQDKKILNFSAPDVLYPYYMFEGRAQLGSFHIEATIASN